MTLPVPAAARLLLATCAAALMPLVASAQPARAQNPPDIAGEWTLANNEYDTTAQPPLGDYTGIAFNAAGVMRSETTAESIFGTPEYQCRPHSAPHQWRGLGGARILKEQDPLTREVRTYHIQFMRSLDRPVYMDGRPHPPAWAPHTWTGFSTGEWVGNTLKITTTHLKDGFLHRGGPQTSDMYTMTEFLTRHGDILTIVTVIDDPIYLDEPYIDSTTYTYDPSSSVAFETCNGTAFAENGGSDRHHVPHFLPGSNTADLNEWLKKDDWVPPAVARGGVKTLYPEYRAVVAGTTSAASLTVPASKTNVDYHKQIADQSPRDGQVHVMPVQGNVYLLIADGTNITASVGADGVLVVNTGTAAMAPKLLDAIKQLSVAVSSRPMPKECFGLNCPGAWGWSSPFVDAVIASPAPPHPIRYIINTSAAPEHVGGNQTIAAAGFFPRVAGGFGTAVDNIGRGAAIVAHENVAAAMSAAKAPAAAQPTDSFFDEFDKLPEYVNGEPILMYAAPNANTDGDSFVFFRHSEVIAAGNLFSTISYPAIDLTKGGTIQGVIDGLNKILDLAVAEYRGQGGTMIVPGRGRLSDTADVASYRNMLTIVRDRVQDLVKKGQTLEQVRAARPTFDFDGRYGSDPVATDKFIEAVYRTVQKADSVQEKKQ
jgi:glyoxylase-like metal-dependent hydrolase (beta-lactamase superfamily II)